MKLLPAADGPYSDYDLCIIEQIILLAEQICQQDYIAGRGGKDLTLAKLLQAYEVVLPTHGVVPAEDVYYYRILLKLSLDPDVSWWSKFDKQCKANSRCAGEKASSTAAHDAGKSFVLGQPDQQCLNLQLPIAIAKLTRSKAVMVSYDALLYVLQASGCGKGQAGQQWALQASCR